MASVSCIGFTDSPSTRCPLPVLPGGFRFCSQHAEFTEKPRQQYKMCEEQVNTLVRNPDSEPPVCSDDNTIDEIRSIIDYYRVHWKAYWRLHQARLQFRDRFIALECRDAGHDYQIHLAAGFSSRYEQIMGHIGELLGKKLAEDQAERRPISTESEAKPSSHRRIKRSKPKRKTEQHPTLSSKVGELRGVCEDALLSEYIASTNLENESLDTFETSLRELNRVFWVNRMVGFPEYQTSFYEFTGLPVSNMGTPDLIQRIGLSRTPEEKRRMITLCVHARKDMERFCAGEPDTPSLSDAMTRVNTHLHSFKDLLLKRWESISRDYVQSLENARKCTCCNHALVEGAQGSWDKRDEKMTGHYGVDRDVLFASLARMFHAQKKSPEYMEARNGLVKYCVACIKGTNLEMANEAYSWADDLPKRTKLGDLHIDPNGELKEWETIFELRVTDQTRKEDLAYFIRDHLLAYLGVCYFWDLSAFVNEKAGLVDFEMLFTWCYHKGDVEHRIW